MKNLYICGFLASAVISAVLAFPVNIFAEGTAWGQAQNIDASWGGKSETGNLPTPATPQSGESAQGKISGFNKGNRDVVRPKPSVRPAPPPAVTPSPAPNPPEPSPAPAKPAEGKTLPQELQPLVGAGVPGAIFGAAVIPFFLIGVSAFAGGMIGAALAIILVAIIKA